MKIFKKEVEKTRNFKTLMSAFTKDPDLKQHGKDISKLIPSLLKDASKVPQEILNQTIEFNNLEESKASIEKEFNCTIEIEKAEQSSQPKAKNASPSKPAILIE